jgi:hypothetical protein
MQSTTKKMTRWTDDKITKLISLYFTVDVTVLSRLLLKK